MYKIFVKGIVQGVGFRPYIFRKAKELKLVGSVKNTGNGVEIMINDHDFIEKLDDLPPLARISDWTAERIETKEEYSDFSILESSFSDGETTLPADIFMCNDCLKELRDQNDRRYNYYFITCTNCGPRFSMIEDYPYDRPLTSMKEFKMCNACNKEYTDPMHRRYHAQTIACKDCGPKLNLVTDGKKFKSSSDIDTIKQAVSLIKKGEIISIKGVGGYHICSLPDDKTVGKVRELLQREHKPFAIMVKDIKQAKQIAQVTKREEELLKSPERPIVVLKKKQDYQTAFNSISELDSLGIMLPYTSLHYLLFDFIDSPLLMTSCNIPGEPVSIKEAITKNFLTHEREIVNRCDDSVLKLIDNNVHYLRRSRGFAPIPIKIPIKTKDTIAVGAEMNNIICTAKNAQCYLSQYIGNTSKLATIEFMKQTVDKFIKLTRLKPEIIACDLHPAYNSTRLAKNLAEKYKAKLIPIQHHKAHVASVGAEHDLKDYVGIAIDGLGYGEDEKIWGGEVFDVKDQINFTRIGHLEEQPQLGGDSATTYPKRMLFGILSKFLDKNSLLKLDLFDEKEVKVYLQQVTTGFNTPLTTSAGRILDAAAALLGLCDKRTYDGRPAMLLESIASSPYDIEPVFLEKNGKTILCTTDIFKFLLDNLDKEKARLAATVQIYLAKGLYQIASSLTKPIVASGGVCYNRMISSYLLQKGILFNKEVPCGDGGICYGQVYLANLIA